MKTSKFSRVHSTSKNSDVFHSRDEIYLVFTSKSKFSVYFSTVYRLHVMSHLLQKEVLKMQNENFSKPN